MNIVTDEMVDAYKTAFDGYMRDWTAAVDKDAARHPGREATRAGLAAITAYLASIQAEPAAFVSKSIIDAFDVDGTEMVDAMLFPKGTLRPSEELALYASPVPPSPVSVEMVLAVLESLAEAARSSCDARQFPALTEALAEADYSLKGRG